MIDLSQISIVPDAFILEVIRPDRIVVINLDRRPDRWEAMQTAWPPEIARRFERFPATDGRDLPRERAERFRDGRDLSLEKAAAEEACRDSWVRAVTRFGPGLYFEDDAWPCLPWPYGSPPADAEIVLLGGNAWPKARQPGWERVRAAVGGSHAVWLRTQRAADALLDAWQSPEGMVLIPDVGWNPVLVRLEAAIAVPQIVVQADLGTDIQMGREFPPFESTPYDPWASLEGSGAPWALKQYRQSKSRARRESRESGQAESALGGGGSGIMGG